MKFSQKYTSRHKQPNELTTEMPALDALHALQEVILTLVPDASIGINNAEQTLTFSSRKLTEAINVNVLETTKVCSLQIESRDLTISNGMEPTL
jgi:hypothetical protein